MKRTTILFFYALILGILFIQHIPLLFFAPFLVITFYKQPLISSLWLSLICGLIIDLFAAHTPMGLHALEYCLATFLLYSLRSYFFEDSFSTVPILTFCFSIVSTLIQSILLYSFGQELRISWSWVRSDLLMMPLVDALYAALFFSLPALFIPKAQAKRTRHFSLKEEK